MSVVLPVTYRGPDASVRVALREVLYFEKVAPWAGFEPATNRLTAGCSTTELPGNNAELRQRPYNKAKLLWKG